jgi:hypothetical protein
MSPPPTTRPDVAGSDGIQEDKQKPKQPISSLNRRSRQKDDYTYDSRKSSSEDDRVSIKLALVDFLIHHKNKIYSSDSFEHIILLIPF